jgi:hypothetical protein
MVRDASVLPRVHYHRIVVFYDYPWASHGNMLQVCDAETLHVCVASRLQYTQYVLVLGLSDPSQTRQREGHK